MIRYSLYTFMNVINNETKSIIIKFDSDVQTITTLINLFFELKKRNMISQKISDFINFFHNNYDESLFDQLSKNQFINNNPLFFNDKKDIVIIHDMMQQFIKDEDKTFLEKEIIDISHNNEIHNYIKDFFFIKTNEKYEDNINNDMDNNTLSLLYNRQNDDYLYYKKDNNLIENAIQYYIDSLCYTNFGFKITKSEIEEGVMNNIKSKGLTIDKMKEIFLNDDNGISLEFRNSYFKMSRMKIDEDSILKYLYY